MSRTEEALRNSQYSDAVFRLGNLLINPDTEDYFVPDRHRAGRIISFKADAQRILNSMKEPGRTSYELQFGSDAKHLLDKAVLAGDIHQISEVSRMFFHTHAGQLATFLLGRHHLDHGHPLASALTLQRLAQSTAARAQYDPALSLALAMAWLQAGNRHKAAKSLEHFQHFSTSLPADVPQLPQDLFGDVELALAWLDKQIVAHDRIRSIDETQWLIYQGDASRTGISLGDVPLIVSDDPLVNCRWRVPVASDEAMENEILKKQRQYQLLNIPAMPRLYPLASKNIILMRTPRYVFAVDAQTGNRLWRYDDFQSTLSDQAYSDLHGREFQNSGQTGRQAGINVFGTTYRMVKCRATAKGSTSLISWVIRQACANSFYAMESSTIPWDRETTTNWWPWTSLRKASGNGSWVVNPEKMSLGCQQPFFGRPFAYCGPPVCLG